jgi:hypothetical protein
MAEETVFQKIAGVIGSYAPGIAAILAASGVGAPVAGVVGALGAICKTIGVPETTPADGILTTIQGLPDSELKLKFVQAENDFQLKKRDQDIEAIKIGISDTQNARDRQLGHEKTTGKTDINLYTLSWVIVLGFLAVVSMLLFIPIPKEQTNVIFTLLGTLGAGFMLVLQFFYGTNRSSETKTDMIYNSTPNVPKKEV